MQCFAVHIQPDVQQVYFFFLTGCCAPYFRIPLRAIFPKAPHDPELTSAAHFFNVSTCYVVSTVNLASRLLRYYDTGHRLSNNDVTVRIVTA
jgi:hypothetical protein